MKKNSNLHENLSINKTDDISLDVRERLAAQERKLVIQRDKERIRKRRKLRKEKENVPKPDPGSIEVLHKILYDEEKKVESYSDNLLKDESEFEFDANKYGDNIGMKSNFMLEKGKALPTLKD